MNRSALKKVIERDNENIKKNWEDLINELLEGRVRIDTSIRERLFNGNAPLIHQMFDKLDDFVRNLTGNTKPLEFSSYRKQLNIKD